MRASIGVPIFNVAIDCLANQLSLTRLSLYNGNVSDILANRKGSFDDFD